MEPHLEPQTVVPAILSPKELSELPCVVCLGASAGGLEALQDFFDFIPEDLDIPFVVVVHLSPDFKSLMPELLSKHTSMPVRAAEDGTLLRPNHVYIIPPNKNMILSDWRLRLQAQDRTPGHALNLPIDIFLKSLADSFSIAVILSGTGSDGSRGIRSIKESGGVVLVQSLETAKFDGMPLSAIQTGLVDQQGPPAMLAGRVADLIACRLPSLVGTNEGEKEDIDRVLALLRKATGLDMSYFRRQMLRRRIQRRMAIQGVEVISGYIERLAQDEPELKHLGEDFLIGVTSFFRDPDAFKVLQTGVLQDLLLGLPPKESLRVWVTACSTGNEVYSIAMLLLQAMSSSGVERDLKIFATDVDQKALEHASRGVYTTSEAADVPAPLLNKYFEKIGDDFVVRPELREKIIFARHNLVTDPPFTKMHLVSCRNLLIYLESEAQTQVLGTLFTALKPNQGILFLGPAETPGPIENGLSCLNARAKLYQRTGFLPRSLSTRLSLKEPISIVHATPPIVRPSVLDTRAQAQNTLLRQVLEAAFEAEGQSAVVIDQNSRLTEILTDPLSIFRLPKGKPTDDLTRILSRGLITAIASGQQQLKAGKQSASYVVPESDDSGSDLTVFLRRLPGNTGLILLVLKAREHTHFEKEAKSIDPSSLERVATLELELRQTRESLQATIEELQSSNEEQQSTNEELVASNEELQSTNEELHSVNEELYTVNAEYHAKNQELQVITADLDNLLNSISVATLYLDEQLRIRKFTPSVSRVLPLQAVDHGRPIADLTHQLDTDFVGDVEAVLATEKSIEREVRDREGAWVLMRLSPYQTLNGTGQGVLATFVDVTRIKNTEETARVMGEQVARANQKLTAQTEQLEDIFSIVAHDLKRPVVSLDGVLKLARKNLESGNNDGTQKHLGFALKAADSLRTMLKDLSHISQLRNIELHPEPVDLELWMDEVLQPFLARAKQQGVRLIWICDNRLVRFARAAAHGIINNLTENALIHGTSNKKPKIEITCQVEDGQVRFTVIDNGRGIAKEHHERIFELFRRLSPDETEGSGVGLVAARRFAQRAQGNTQS